MSPLYNYDQVVAIRRALAADRLTVPVLLQYLVTDDTYFDEYVLGRLRVFAQESVRHRDHNSERGIELAPTLPPK